MIPRLDDSAQELLRDLAPAVLSTLVRRYRDFGGCEDAVQDAMLAAAIQWPAQGVPDNPKGWLITVATRRLTDRIRADTARRLREHLVISLIPSDEQIALAADAAVSMIGTRRSICISCAATRLCRRHRRSRSRFA